MQTSIRGQIEHRAAKVSLVNGLSTILALVFQFVSVPVCLKFWGSESYGSWLSLFSAFMLLRSLDGGFAAYVGNKLNYLYHQNKVALHDHLSSAVAGIALLGGLQVVIAAGAIFFGPLADALGMPAGHRESVGATLGLLTLVISWVLTGSYLGIVHRLLIPAGMMYQAAWWAMAFQMTQFAAIMTAASLRLGMLATSLLFAISQIAAYVASAIYVRRALPEFCPWLRGAKVRLGLEDLRHSSLLTGSNMIQQSATNGVVLVIAALAGPGSVPLFTTVRTMANLWTSVTTVLTAPLLPEVVRLHAKGEAHKLGGINQAYWVVVGSAVNIGALLCYPLMPFLYAQWTAHSVALDQPLLALLLAGVVVANSGALMALHLNGINSLRIVLAASLVRAVVGLGGGALGFGVLGLPSFGLGILGGELFATLMTARHFLKQELNVHGVRWPAKAFGPVSMGTGSALVYFLGAGLGAWTGSLSWLLALFAVATASIWGWRTLQQDLRDRLGDLATHWMPLR